MDALKKIQQKLKAPKSQQNTFGHYNYRSCEDILEAVKPLLAEFDATLLLSDELVQVGERYYIKATAKFVHESDSTEVTAYAREADIKKGMDESQITGTASSYARKYALNGLFLIDDTKDADTDEYTSKSKGSDKPAKKPMKNGVNFQEVREKLTEIDTLDELNSYWTSLNLTQAQANILKSDFSARKVKIGVGA